jgi:hypothetical protein
MGAYASQTIFASPVAAELPRKVKGRTMVGSGAELDECQTAFLSNDARAYAVKYAIKMWGNVQPELVIPKVKERPLIPSVDGAPIAPLVLPESSGSTEGAPASTSAATIAVPFDESDLIAIALDRFNGDLRASKIYEAVSADKIVTRDRVRQMVNTIVERGRTEYQGIHYRTVLRPGNFHTLVMLTADMTVGAPRPIPHDDSRTEAVGDNSEGNNLEKRTLADDRQLRELEEAEYLLAAGD